MPFRRRLSCESVPLSPNFLPNTSDGYWTGEGSNEGMRVRVLCSHNVDKELKFSHFQFHTRTGLETHLRPAPIPESICEAHVRPADLRGVRMQERPEELCPRGPRYLSAPRTTGVRAGPRHMPAAACHPALWHRMATAGCVQSLLPEATQGKKSLRLNTLRISP